MPRHETIGKESSEGSKSNGIGERFHKSIDKNMGTERIFCRAKTGNTCMPTDKVVLNTIDLTARLEKRVSQFITIPKIP